MNKRQDLRLLPQALMFIAVEAGFLETPEEAAQGRVNYLQISKVYFQVPFLITPFWLKRKMKSGNSVTSSPS
jgi:hypothetical protein